jgi:hypothetical protein
MGLDRREEMPQTDRGRWRRTIALSGATAVIAGSAVLLGGFATPASAAPPEKVVICHATASDTNPYVSEEVSSESILNIDGHGANGINAGDIIPPFEGYDGQNWDATGQSIWNNDCAVPGVEETPTATVSATETTTETTTATSTATATATVTEAALGTEETASPSAGVAGVAATNTTNPVPAGVAAGRHAPAGGALWLGALLMLAGVGGLMTSFRPWKRGVH